MMETEQRVYNTHLKKVLKTYQLTAQRSLKGPAGVSAAAAATASKEEAAKEAAQPSSPAAPTAAPTPPATAPPPVFYTQDRPKNSELLETVLRTARISCFNVGGELRLCLPEVIKLVLYGFQASEIYAQCDELHIHCSRCNQEQLEVLRSNKRLPDTAHSCGLITQTDAERLCGALLNNAAQHSKAQDSKQQQPQAFRVYHECFGLCYGLLTPAFFDGNDALCVECETCRCMFSMQDFVTHVHLQPENLTCHWGFNSANWRAYVLLDEDQKDLEHLQALLAELKQRPLAKYDKPHKRKQFEEVIKSESPLMHIPEKVINGKRLRIHERAFELAGLMPAEVPVLGPPPYTFHDPYAAYWFHPAWMASPYRTSWTVPAAVKEATKSANGREPPQFPSFLSHAPPVLMDPNRVVPFSESDRFESQPNVALAPLSQSLHKTPPYAKKESSKEVKHEVAQRPSSTTAPGHTYNPEIELSTDTEDSNSANGADDETSELLGSLARCIQEVQGDTRQKGESALHTLGANLIASREAHKALASEVQLLRQRLEQLECKLTEERDQHDKEIAAMSLERLRTPREHVVIQNPLVLQNGSPQRTSPATSVITSSSAIVKKEPLGVE